MFTKPDSFKKKQKYIPILSLLLLIILNQQTSSGQDNQTKKFETAAEQLRYAVQLDFSVNDMEKKDGYKHVIQAYQAVELFFPDSTEKIYIAKSNLANFYARQLKEYKKARVMYKEVLSKLPDESSLRRSIYKGLILCLPGDTGSKNNYKEFIMLKNTYKEATGILSIEYSALCLGNSMQQSSLEEGNRLRSLAEKVLKESILQEVELSIKELIIIRHFLGLVPLLDIGHEAMLKKKMKIKLADSVEKKLNLLVINNATTIATQFPPAASEFDYKSMLKHGNNESIVYIIRQREEILNAVQYVLSRDMGNEQLSAQSKNILELIQEYHFIEVVSLLEKRLGVLNNKEDINEVRNTIEVLVKKKDI